MPQLYLCKYVLQIVRNTQEGSSEDEWRRKKFLLQLTVMRYMSVAKHCKVVVSKMKNNISFISINIKEVEKFLLSNNTLQENENTYVGILYPKTYRVGSITFLRFILF